MNFYLTRYGLLLLLFPVLSCGHKVQKDSSSEIDITGFWEVMPFDDSTQNQMCFVQVTDTICIYWLEEVGYPFPGYYSIENDSIFFWKRNPNPTPREFRGVIEMFTDSSFAIEGSEPKILFTRSDFEKFKLRTGEPCWNCKY